MSLSGKLRDFAGPSLLVLVLGQSLAADQPVAAGDSLGKEKGNEPTTRHAPLEAIQSVHAKYRRMFQDAEEAIQPLPLTPIPDNPPPHEGAMFDLPYVIEPPDLLIIEVLETLPGRPISGERLVRPDGTISLGFYGNLHVRGLTLDQAKTKVVHRLRHWLTDTALGLVEEGTPAGAAPIPIGVPEGKGDPRGKGVPDVNEVPIPPPPPSTPRDLVKPRAQPSGHDNSPSPIPGGPKVHKSVMKGARTDVGALVAPMAVPLEEMNTDVPVQPPAKIVDIPTAGGAKVSVTITVVPSPTSPTPIEAVPGAEDEEDMTAWTKAVDPVASSAVFVDMGSYNSKSYCIQGDVVVTGKYPWTGHETVLDAINNANGFMPTAEQRDVRLVRPARGGRPAKVYKIDFKAIVEQGDARQNLQLFPGDRVVVGRNAVVEKTVQIDRFYAPLQTVLTGMNSYANMMRSLSLAAPDLSAEQRQAIVSDWIDFWWKAVSGPDGAVLDKKVFEDALKRHLEAPPKRTTAPESKK